MSGARTTWITLMGMLGLGAALLTLVVLGGCPRGNGGATSVVNTGGAGQAGISQEALQKIRDTTVLVEVSFELPQGSVQGSGTGFVVNGQGRIVTNAHVVSPEIELDDGRVVNAVSRKVQVVFHPATDREQTYDAQVLRESSDVDLALLKIDQATPTFLDLGDSDAIAETAKILACGYPLGLREISFRGGMVTAHRNFDGKTFLEHDAEADDGNSGGPVVDEQARVVGVHTYTRISRNMSTKWAIPSNVVRTWLTSDPSGDPPVYFASASGGRPIEGGSAATGGTVQGGSATPAVEELLAASGLTYSLFEGSTYEVPFDNDATVYVASFDDLLRVYVVYGDMPSGAGPAALRFTYYDPVGRLSLTTEDGRDKLYWEAQVPMGSASGEYLRDLCVIAANQIESFANYLRTEKEPESPTDLYPGGDAATLLGQLKQIADGSTLIYEMYDEDTLKIPFDNEVNVYANIYNGVAYIHAYGGGLPGQNATEATRLTADMLRFNWNDPIGRLALDDDYDVVWECQVPMNYLTSDYFYIVCSIAANQVEAYWGEFGKIPFNADRSG